MKKGIVGSMVEESMARATETPLESSNDEGRHRSKTRISSSSCIPAKTYLRGEPPICSFLVYVVEVVSISMLVCYDQI